MLKNFSYFGAASRPQKRRPTIATSKARDTLATVTQQYNQLAESLGEKTVKKFRDKTTAKERLAALKTAVAPAAYNYTKGTFTGRTADFNIDLLPKDERKAPKEGSLLVRALAMMQNGDITLEGEGTRQGHERRYRWPTWLRADPAGRNQQRLRRCPLVFRAACKSSLAGLWRTR